jgi:hypothetical protein
MKLKSEYLALIFGMLTVFVNFSDNWVKTGVGNLDMIFGKFFWPATDFIYTLASILIFFALR